MTTRIFSVCMLALTLLLTLLAGACAAPPATPAAATSYTATPLPSTATTAPAAIPTTSPAPTATLATSQTENSPVVVIRKLDVPEGVNNNGMAVDSQGNLYAADLNTDLVEKYNNQGKLVTKIDGRGTSDESFRFTDDTGFPWGFIAIDKQDNLYVADAYHCQIKKFDSNGKFLMKFGSKGTGKGQFQQAASTVQVDNEGNIYVSEPGHIQKFDAQGNFLANYGKRGTGDGEFSDMPMMGPFDKEGNFYVADLNNARIQKFDRNGKFLLKWGTQGQGEGQFGGPVGIAFDSQGKLYVTDNSSRVQIFDPNGKFLGEWQAPIAHPKGGLDGVGIAIDKNDNIYVNWGGQADPLMIYEFHPRNAATTPSSASTTSVTTTVPAPTATLTTTASTAIQTPTLISNFALQGLSISTTVTGLPMPALGITENATSPIEYVRTVAAMKNQEQTSTGPMAFDAQGNIYLGDDTKATISKYDSQGKFVLAWGSYGSANGQFAFTVPSGEPPNSGRLAIDSHGNVYVSDIHNSRIQKFDGNGHFLLSWGRQGSGDGEFNVTTGIAIDRADNIYVGDQGNYRIQKFDSNGKFLTKWGSQGQGDGQFTTPNALALDNQGNLYVGDALGHHVQKFDSNGKFITKWGSEGAGDGQFGIVDDLVVDRQDQVWVSDESSRFQIFSADGKFLGQWSFPSTVDGYKQDCFLRTLDAQGNVYVEHDIANATDTGLEYMFISLFRPRNTAATTVTTIVAVPTATVTTTIFHTPPLISAFALNGLSISTTVTGLPMPALGIKENAGSPIEYVRTVLAMENPEATSIGMMAFDPQGNLYMLDDVKSMVSKYDRQGKFLFAWVGYGSKLGQFAFTVPSGEPPNSAALAIDSHGNVYVSDTHNSRIQKFDGNGHFLLSWGRQGKGDGEFDVTLGIYIDPADNVYVWDVGNNRFQKFDSNGKFLTKSSNIMPTPADSHGNFYGMDGFKVQKFDKDGHLLATWGSEGLGDGQFEGGVVLLTDPQDHLWVMDATRIQVFSTDGKFLGQWRFPPGPDGREPYLYPLTMDAQGNLYMEHDIFDAAGIHSQYAFI